MNSFVKFAIIFLLILALSLVAITILDRSKSGVVPVEQIIYFVNKLEVFSK